MKPVTSVIICTHNPRPDYLQRVLDALRNQTLPLDQWELLLIDNASETALARDWDLSWHPQGRHVHQKKTGLSFARQKGIEEASSDLLVFVDDDNVVSPDYLVQALQIEQDWPQLGVWGGSILPEFEIEPPVGLRKFLGYLALREIKTARWTNIVECSDAQPWGAGFCVRANVATAYIKHCRETNLNLTGRENRNLLSGDDTEICYVACSIGLGFGVFPELNILHLISSNRLREDYIIRLVEGITTSTHLVRYKWDGIYPKSPKTVREISRIVVNLLMSRGVDRQVYLSILRGASVARSMLKNYSGGQ